jgi:hypothetical protein
MWTYEQTTGNIYQDGVYVGPRYSGLDDGKNNPDMQDVQGKGPIPVGEYSIGAMEDSGNLGPAVMPLEPQPATETFGRSGFFIHGDDIQHPGEGSPWVHRPGAPTEGPDLGKRRHRSRRGTDQRCVEAFLAQGRGHGVASHFVARFIRSEDSKRHVLSRVF